MALKAFGGRMGRKGKEITSSPKYAPQLSTVPNCCQAGI